MSKFNKIFIYSTLLTASWIIVLCQIFFVHIESEILESGLFLTSISSIIVSTIGLYKTSERFKRLVTSLVDDLFWFV